MNNTKQTAERASADSAYVHDVTVNASKTLDSVLAEIVRTEQVQENGVTVTRPVYNREHTWNITIASGYAATISNRYGGIRCNFHLKGAGTAKSKIYISKNVVTQTGCGDSILELLGESPLARIGVSFQNVEFMPVGAVAGTTFVPSSATNFPENASAHLIKVYFADSVILYKLSSTLMNGAITNVDLRTCDGVVVDSCVFVNDNGVMTGNRTGGILWMRGSMDSVRVTGCSFTKYGNDEVFGIFEGVVPESSYNDVVPEYMRSHIVHRNIHVSHNTFRYRRPTVSGSLAASNSADILITLSSTPYAGVPATCWDNVLIAFNTILLEDNVKRVFAISDLQNVRSLTSFCLYGNTITHSYTLTTDGAMVMDFALSGSEISGLRQQAVEITGNEIIAKETLSRTYHGHAAIYMHGGAAEVKDNLIDGTELKFTTLYGGQPNGIIPMRISEYSCRLSFSGNRCLNTGILGYFTDVADAQGSSVKRKIVLRVADNYVEGVSKFGFQNMSSADLRVSGNYFRSRSYELLAQEFALNGSLWGSDNVWDAFTSATDPKYSGVVFASYGSAKYALDRAAFLSNVIGGERPVASVSLPAAEHTFEANNALLNKGK